MLTMYAEVRQNGTWHKVGKEFASTYEELDSINEFTDRVYDRYDKKLVNFLIAQSTHGIPDDVSEEIKTNKYFQNLNNIYHVNLRCLLEFFWEKQEYETGYISEWQYKRMRLDGIDPVHIRSAPPTGAIVASSFMAELLEKRPELNKENKPIYVQYDYDHHMFYETQEFFCEVSIPELVDLIPENGSLDDVRIIFSI